MISARGLFETSCEVPDEDYEIPFGQAAFTRQGNDVTIVALSSMVNKANAVADKLATQGIAADVIDPRTTSPLDEDAILIWEFPCEILRNGSALPAAGNGGEVSEDGLGTFAWLDSAQLISDLCIEQSLGRSARKRRCGLCSSYSGKT